MFRILAWLHPYAQRENRQTSRQAPACLQNRQRDTFSQDPVVQLVAHEDYAAPLNRRKYSFKPRSH